MRTLKASLALLLSLVLLLGCLPLGIFATEAQAELPATTPVTATEGGLITSTSEWIGDTPIGNVAEAVSLREENVKHFRLADGTYEAIAYPFSVHTLDAEGKWQDINNNL